VDQVTPDCWDLLTKVVGFYRNYIHPLSGWLNWIFCCYLSWYWVANYKMFRLARNQHMEATYEATDEAKTQAEKDAAGRRATNTKHAMDTWRDLCSWRSLLLVIAAFFFARLTYVSIFLSLQAYFGIATFVTRVVRAVLPIIRFEGRGNIIDVGDAAPAAQGAVQRAHNVADGVIPPRAGVGFVAANADDSDSSDEEVAQLVRGVHDANIHEGKVKSVSDSARTTLRDAARLTRLVQEGKRGRRGGRRRRFVYYPDDDDHRRPTVDQAAIDDFMTSHAARQLAQRNPDFAQELDDEVEKVTTRYLNRDDQWLDHLDDEEPDDFYDQQIFEEARRVLEAIVGSIALRKPAPRGVRPRSVMKTADVPQAPPKKEEFPSVKVKNEAFHAENPPVVSYHKSITCLKDKAKKPVNSAIRVGTGLLTTKHAAAHYAYADDVALPASYKRVDLADDLTLLAVTVPGVDCVPVKHLRVPVLGEKVVVNDKLNGKSSQATINNVLKDGDDITCQYDASTELGTCGTPVVAVSDNCVVGIHNADRQFIGISPRVLKFFRNSGSPGTSNSATSESAVASTSSSPGQKSNQTGSSAGSGLTGPRRNRRGSVARK